VDKFGSLAKAGQDHVALPQGIAVRFEDGEMTKTFDIVLLQTDATGSPTSRLYVQLVAVDSDAVLVGPASRTRSTKT